MGCKAPALVPDVTFNTSGKNTYVFDPRSCVVVPNQMAHRLPKAGGAPSELVPPTPQDIKTHILRYGLAELIIEVTALCNHRCAYCIYSEFYQYQRDHSKDNITDENVIRAVDFYLDQLEVGAIYNPRRKPIITFYGGEPLINYRAVRLAVEHAEARCKERPLFLLTTNATLLTKSIIDHFIEHEFIRLFSIDGDREDHDRNRRFVNKRPTHSRVTARVRDYVNASNKPAFVDSVIDPKTDLVRMMEYFVSTPDFWPYAISPANYYGTSYYSQFTPCDFDRMRGQFKELSALFRELMSVDEVSDEDRLRRRFLYALVGRGALHPFLKTFFKEEGAASQPLPFTGSCVPGDKLFVDYKGTFYACEKITRNAPIGSLDKGFDFQAIARIVEGIYSNIIVKGCRTCFARNTCSLCLQSFLPGDEIVKSEEDCVAARQGYLDSLSRGYELAEQNPAWIEQFTADYHGEIRALAIRQA